MTKHIKTNKNELLNVLKIIFKLEELVYQTVIEKEKRKTDKKKKESKNSIHEDFLVIRKFIEY